MICKQRMKIKDTLNIYDSDGIFELIRGKVKDLQIYPTLEHVLDSFHPTNLDYLYYLSHSGEKYISPIYQSFLENMTQVDGLTELASIIISKFAEKWERMISALYSDYDPINNYDLIEHEEYNTKQSSSSNGTNSAYGYNESSAKPTNSANTTTQSGGTAQDNYRNLTRSGNIGVTTTQQMINSELDLRMRDLFDIIMMDVDSILTLSVY